MLVALAAMSVICSVHAQRSGVTFGAGNVGCGTYIEDRQKSSPGADIQYVQFAQGFLSAYNLYGSQKALESVPRGPTVLAYLDKHCREHPLDDVMSGITSLIGDLGGYRSPSLR
jgi:hypothetical protein